MGGFFNDDNFLGIAPIRFVDPLNFFNFDQSGQNRANDQAAAYRASAPRPGDPTWNPIWTPFMSTAPKVNSQLDKTSLDMSGYNRFKQDALREGPSQWATRSTAQQETLAKNAKDEAARSAAGQGATARSQLAMRGGLTGGARERLAMEGQQNVLNMDQAINRDKNTNIAQIGMNDEQNRMQQLSMLPGMATQAGAFDLSKIQMGNTANQFDVANQMANNQSKNQFDLDRYKEQMQAWGAAQTAAATTQAGKHKK